MNIHKMIAMLKGKKSMILERTK